MTERIERGVDSTLHSLVETLLAEAEELVETMFARMRTEVPTFDIDSRPELSDALMASCYGNVRAALGALGGNRQPPGSPPAEAVEAARASARARVALEPLLHTYRVGHAVVLERVLELLEEMKLSPTQRRSAQQIGSRYLFAYVDRMASLVTEEYAAERDRVMRSSIQRRVQLVRDVLSGSIVTPSELGYELEQDHIALIATGRGAEAALHELAESLDRRLLTVAMTQDTVWAWLGSVRRFDDRERRQLPRLLAHTDIRFSLGEPGRGPDGFRDSHDQALAAHRVASHLRQQITHYDDVALEAALLTDVRTARRFVERELGPLAHSDHRSAALRETLSAYLGTGLNAAAAAAMLGVSDRTIAYRIRGIEDVLARNVSTRSAELATALRLHRVFEQ